jgi:inner membrane protein
MDTITHLALGAVIGEAMVGKKIGKKALAMGAVAQVLPDIDVVASLWLPPAANLLAHRGVTHSFVFVPVAAALLTFVVHGWFKGKVVSVRQWFIFFSLQLLVHDLIDGFNAYGVGWFEPFHTIRISFNTIFVADPFLTISLIVGAVALTIIGKENSMRLRWAIIPILITLCYLLYALYNKYHVIQEIPKLLSEQQVRYKRYFTTPTPFNTWLWFVVAEDDSGYYTGYRSIFDSKPFMPLTYFPRQDSLLNLVEDKQSLKQLIRFSQGYYTVEQTSQGLIFNNLRFGQIAGWHDSRAPFAFHYYLDNPTENLMVIQRGRFTGWNDETINSLIERIKGN